MIQIIKRSIPGICGVALLMTVSVFSDLYLPTLMADSINNGVMNGDTAHIFSTGGRMLIIALISVVCAVGSGFLTARIAFGFGKDLRESVFKRIEAFSLNEFDAIGAASLITRSTNDVTQIQQTGMMALTQMLRAPLMGAGSITLATMQNARLSLIFVVAIPVMLVLVALVMRKAIPLFTSMQTRLDTLNMTLREKLTGAREIRAFNRAEHERKRFDRANTAIKETSASVATLMAITQPIMMIIMNAVMIGAVWFGGRLANEGAMQVGDIMAFAQYSFHVLFSLMMISMLFVMIPRAQASIRRVKELFALTPSINDPERPITPSPNVTGEIEFRNVTFAYKGAELPALNNVSFCAKKGEFVAIIGSSGSGKSTLAHLLMRFYDVTDGAILLDGVDVREMKTSEIVKRVGYVSQKASLFSGTIEDALRFAEDDTPIERIQEAADIACASEFIMQKEGGFSALLTQGATNLSGGQKQRLSIARALTKDAEIYLLDDAFSALDFKTDASIRDALRKRLKGKTTIMIAQRVSSIIGADRIVVLNEGEIAGMGTHKELLASSETYREIVYSQISPEEIA